MRRRAVPAVSILSVFALLGLPAIFAAGQGRTAKTLDIYVVDVEGGNATLFVSPSGESLLIDTGNGGPAAPRDAGRILAAARDAGVTQIDHLVTTHWHGDHVGGLAEFARRMPIRHFIDHGANVQPGPGIDEFLTDAYPKLYEKGTHTVARPGDRIAVAGLDVRVVSSAGQVLTTPLPGAGKPKSVLRGVQANRQQRGGRAIGGHLRPLRPVSDASSGRPADDERIRADVSEQPHRPDRRAARPASRAGYVELRGAGPRHSTPSRDHEQRNAQGRLAGRHEDAVFLARSRGRLADAFLASRRPGYTVPGMFIANVVDDQPAALPIAPAPLPAGANAPPPPAHDGQAYWIKVSARDDGTFTVTNARNGFSKTYAPRSRERH